MECLLCQSLSDSLWNPSHPMTNPNRWFEAWCFPIPGFSEYMHPRIPNFQIIVRHHESHFSPRFFPGVLPGGKIRSIERVTWLSADLAGKFPQTWPSCFVDSSLSEMNNSSVLCLFDPSHEVFSSFLCMPRWGGKASLGTLSSSLWQNLVALPIVLPSIPRIPKSLPSNHRPVLDKQPTAEVFVH